MYTYEAKNLITVTENNIPDQESAAFISLIKHNENYDVLNFLNTEIS